MPDQRLPLHTLRLLLRLCGSRAYPEHMPVAILHTGTGGRMQIVDISTWRTQP